MCELTLEAAGLDRDKEEWRQLSRDTRSMARKAMQMVRFYRDLGCTLEAASYYHQAMRARRWANEWMREYT